jgi:hypothetical protein
MIVRLATSVALADLAHDLKGGSAHDVNRRSVLAWRLAWQAGYWAESLAPADIDVLAAYLRRQRAHHDDSHPAELWQRGSRPWEPARTGGL